MQVGDLVKHSGMNDVVWFGIITKRSSPYRFHVEWTFGKQGWFHVDSLEVVCK
jgi:hypothetical protein